MSAHPDGDTGDMTGQDPLSSAAEGDEEPGSAALAEAGTGPAAEGSADPDETPEQAGGEPFAAHGPPAEAADEEPVTDAPPTEPSAR